MYSWTGGVSDRTAKLWTLDGALERTFAVGDFVCCVAALPDGAHFVVGLYRVFRLYHVDGTLVHTFEGHTSEVRALAVTPTASTSSAAWVTSSSRCGASPARPS